MVSNQMARSEFEICKESSELKDSINKLQKENAKLRKALECIRDKETCERLHYPSSKYVSYEQAWDGVAEYAGKTLREVYGDQGN